MRVANAPCSWGALEFDWAGAAPPYVRVLDEMAMTGYAGTELGDWGFLPTNPASLDDELSRRRLELLGAFVPVRLSDPAAHEAGVHAALRVAHLMAAVTNQPFVVLSDDTARDPVRTKLAGRITPAQSLDDKGWDSLTRGANTIARRVKEEAGLRTVFHHHCATFVETAAEIDRLMNGTDPALVGLCLDTGHAAFGGGDAAAVATRWSDRIWHVHLKDCDAAIRARSAAEEWDYQQSVRAGVFCELGSGIVNFPAVLERLRKIDYKGWLVVEQDVLPAMGSPAESAARNREFLRSMGL